ncbi:flagellum-specific ATP synthase FliI [Tardibacter chloracetimidivorans]|uniref:Flagellum-specific ATP synthase n=1 Tax=Tardibacter chloracetimidivorans TaxID=1921510 RepID=A0A1L4A033_9SPHN|nr:FliI/YscN family ATPase [Tardibacter chloracetimidivorans]API61247.1 flagellum-specific ATP synthase FliI [Tardibacter chloracetimidivorans]
MLAGLGRLTIDTAPEQIGRLTSYDGLLLEASGLSAPVGTVCSIETAGDSAEAEVIGFRNGRCILMALGQRPELLPDARVRAVSNQSRVDVGPGLLGRVIDGAGLPLDGLGRVETSAEWPLAGRLQNPLERARVTEPFDVGVRALNGLFTFGRGQRVGIIAGSGVGKSVLLGMMTRYSMADVVVVGLIGERSREVTDFVATKLSGPARDRSVVVAVPANHSPIMRIRAAHRATAIAEYFRDQGKNVLLILDSLTRVAHAQREIGLALGEQPTARGYPPSVISLLPNLIERAGNDAKTGGSITAFYTVLADGDDTVGDPVVDTARAILDGHIVLSRAQAERGVYPAVDIAASISRVMTDVATREHVAAARALKRAAALYDENRDLILMGAYARGSDQALDQAITAQPHVTGYLLQPEDEPVDMATSVAELTAVFGA